MHATNVILHNCRSGEPGAVLQHRAASERGHDAGVPQGGLPTAACGPRPAAIARALLAAACAHALVGGVVAALRQVLSHAGNVYSFIPFTLKSKSNPYKSTQYYFLLDEGTATRIRINFVVLSVVIIIIHCSTLDYL